jgi:hypothetical protein
MAVYWQADSSTAKLRRYMEPRSSARVSRMHGSDIAHKHSCGGVLETALMGIWKSCWLGAYFLGGDMEEAGVGRSGSRATDLGDEVAVGRPATGGK